MTDEDERQLDDLIPRLENALAAAFLAAIALLRSGIDFAALTRALQAGDIDAAVDALNIERAAFSGYALEQQTAFAKAGALASAALSKDKAAHDKRQARTSPAPDVAPPIAYEPQRAPSPVAAPVDPVGQSPALPKNPESSPDAIRPPAPPPTPPSLAAPGGGSITFRFDMTNPRAEAMIRTQSATRIVGYVEEQTETARKVIADGFARGEGPQTIATDIAGRINPISGRREGGIVGLSDPQAGYVENMRRRLLSSDPDEMMKVLGRFDKDGKWVEGTGMTLRDRRFDRSVKKAIRDVAAGKPNPLTGDKIDEMAAKYSDRLLAKRASDIARTETAQGVMSSRAEATRQALERSGLSDDDVTKRWVHLGGVHHARDWHLAMNGKTVVGIEAVFHMPDGSLMKHSHDPEGGAKNNVACRCSTDYDVDWAAGL